MTLKELRLRAGLRQIDVAEKLDVDQAAVSKWEASETRPSRKYHRKLAKIYGCTVDDLLGQTGRQQEGDVYGTKKEGV